MLLYYNKKNFSGKKMIPEKKNKKNKKNIKKKF